VEKKCDDKIEREFDGGVCKIALGLEGERNIPLISPHQTHDFVGKNALEAAMEAISSFYARKN